MPPRKEWDKQLGKRLPFYERRKNVEEEGSEDDSVAVVVVEEVLEAVVEVVVLVGALHRGEKVAIMEPQDNTGPDESISIGQRSLLHLLCADIGSPLSSKSPISTNAQHTDARNETNTGR